MKRSNGEVRSSKELETAPARLQPSVQELANELNVLTQDLTNLLAGLDIPVLILDAALVIRRFNPRAGTLLNLCPADIGRPFGDIDSTLDVTEWEYLFSEATRLGRTIEREVNSRDGHRYSMRIRGCKTSVVVVWRGTKSIIAAEFRALLESIPQSIVGVGADAKIVLINANTEKVFGYRPEELIGQSFEILIPEVAREAHAEYLRFYFAGTRRRPMESALDLQARRKDGTLFPVEIGLSVIDTSAGKLAIAFVNDISERKRMEQVAQAQAQEVRESEERFRNMADTAPVMIWVSGPDKLCTFFNKSWLEFTGRSLAQELGNDWAENVHPGDLDRCWEIYSSSFDARQSFQMEYRLRRADGEYRRILDTGVPRFDPSGSLLGYIGSCVDIEDLKRAHEEHLVKQKLETVGTLAGGIAHDFNNLLGGVLAQAELALAELASGSIPVEELERIRTAASRGAEIVRQLMVYAGEEGETLKLVNVSEIVKDMLELLKVSVSKHVSVKTDFSRQSPMVRANPSQIRQLVMNLFSNASEAIGDRDGVICVSTEGAGDYLQLEVSDTGRGMTPELQARIFDPFFTTKVVGNHGLGLTGVKEIVQQLNGTIRLSSAPGKGTRFQILLPSEEPSAAAAQGPIQAIDDEILASPGPTILVVDDEDILRQGVSKLLRKKGFSVLEAGDGSAALDVFRARKNEIDVLLLDITLPGASSREVYEEVKRLRPDLSVIVTSAKSEEMAAASLGTGIERFLRKPFGLEDLIEMIRQTCALFADRV